MGDAFGSIAWWGFSPPLDLLSTNNDKECTHTENDDFNILLVGAGDIRHILKTLAKSYTHADRKINFYIIENQIEIYAKQILLLCVALETKHRFGLQDKTEMFLEIFGNSLMRRQCIDYVENISTQLIKMITNLEYSEQVFPNLDLSLLKFKERDMMEGVFKFWRLRDADKKVYDADKCWNLRLRKHLGTRYDAVPSVFSWDHGMKLSEKGASIIHNKEYNHWRQYGVAFGIREGTYDMPNKTLANSKVFSMEGTRHVRIGYWGDIVTSPYIAFGIECEDKSFFKTANNQHTKTSQDVSEYNISQMFHEIETKTKYEVLEEPKLVEIVEEEEEEEEEKVDDLAKGDADSNKEFKSIPIGKHTINFLPTTYIKDMHKKSKFNKLFNAAFISNSMFHNIDSTLTSTFSPDCQIICETAKFIIELTSEQTIKYVEKMKEMCEVAGLQSVKNCDPEKDAFGYFELKK